MKTEELKKFDFEENKKQIFDKIVLAIDSAITKDIQQIFIKKLKIVDEEIDVVAQRSEWPTCLNKALDYYKQNEHYEACASCQQLLEILTDPPKKTKKNGSTQKKPKK